MNTIRTPLAILVAAAMTACGGGGGGGGTTALSPSPTGEAVSLAGSVSQGFPISGARVSLLDANGNRVDAGVTDSQGNYRVTDISGLKTPILVSASGVSGGRAITLYGMLSTKLSKSIANVTPMTDAIVTQTAGTSPSLLVKNPTAVANLDPAKADATAAKVSSAVSNVMEQITAGSSANFNPLTTAFTADGKTAADKVNDLVKVTSTITPTGVVTDLTDKSGTVGSVTIDTSSSVGKLPALPVALVSVGTDQVSNFIRQMNEALASANSISSTLLDGLFADDYLDGGLNKAGMVAQIRGYMSEAIGAKLINGEFKGCDVNNVCQIRFTLQKLNGGIDIFENKFKYYSDLKNFKFYGNQNKFGVELYSNVTKSTNLRTGAATLQAQLSVNINKDGDWEKYKSATASFQGPDGAVDLSYSYTLRPTACNPSTRAWYDGLPNDRNSDSCYPGEGFNSTNDAVLKRINEKIKRGGYKIVVKAWTNTTKTGAFDTVEYPLTEPLLTTDRVGADGFPRVRVVQGSNGALPYLEIDNADDFTIEGSLCISRDNWCDASVPIIGTTSQNEAYQSKLPGVYAAKVRDGWNAGDQAKSYFIHVRDKAGRDLIADGSY